MGPLRCRLPARFALSTLLAAVGLTMAAGGAEAATNGLTLAVHVGYQDVVKPGEWTPVTIDMHNTGADVDGRPAIAESATDGLTARQRAAIADFVQSGGNLLLATGASWHKTLAGLPAAILPLEPRATLNVHAARAVGGHNIEAAIADAVSGRAWLSEGAVPLILDRGVGAGTVTLATFDWNQEPIAGWSGTKDLLRQVLARAVFGAGTSGANYPNGIAFGGPGSAFGSPPSIASKSNALTPVLGNLPGLNLPSLQLTAGLVLLYVLLVGPVNYLVLGAMRRRALAWITVPLIAVLAATGAYGAGVLTKGRAVQTNQVAILHLQPGWDRAYHETYTGVIPPSRGDYEARIAGDR